MKLFSVPFFWPTGNTVELDPGVRVFEIGSQKKCRACFRVSRRYCPSNSCPEEAESFPAIFPIVY